MLTKELEYNEIEFLAWRFDDDVRNCIDGIYLKYVGSDGLEYSDALQKNREIINEALSQFPEYQAYMKDRYSSKAAILNEFYYDVKEREKLKRVVDSLRLYEKHIVKLSKDAIEKLHKELSIKLREKKQRGWKINFDLKKFLENIEFRLWFQK